MTYDCRKLSSEQQKAVVEDRRRRGLPLHQPPHPFRESGSYLITAANFEHVPIMETPERRTEFQGILLKRFQEIQAEIIGWSILSNHYHILVNVDSLDSVSGAIQSLHGFTSHHWNQQDGLTGKRKVWYRFSDKLMRNETQLNQTLNYIHYNPVKHGFVKDVYEWPWSSLFMYVDELSKEWLKESWKKYAPPDDYGKDWDS